MRRIRDNGFTLLEVMIALGIFSILMMMIAVMMRAEIGFFNTENKQNQNEQKARMAMNHVLDQVRLNSFVVFNNPAGFDQGLYSNDPDLEEPLCLLNLNPNPAGDLENTEMYYTPDTDKLWLRNEEGKKYVLVEDISILEIEQVGTSRLVRVRVVAGDPASDLSFELVSWIRLF